MTNSRIGDKSFYPGVAYPISQVAMNLDTSETWVKENLVYKKRCAFKKRGQVYIFMGEWLIKWMREDFDLPDEENECK